MKVRTPSGVKYRVRARPIALRRWLVTVQRRQGVTLPVVYNEVVHGLLPPLARVRALAAEVVLRAPARPAPPRPRDAATTPEKRPPVRV